MIALYAFNERRTQTWPIPGWTLDWFEKTFANPGVREALLTSLKAGLGATAIAIVAGALLAFALSFDEVIVTTFTAGAQQTLPIWILTNLSRPNQLPVVNVVAVMVIVLSAIPVYLAHRLTQDPLSAAAPAGESVR